MTNLNRPALDLPWIETNQDPVYYWDGISSPLGELTESTPKVKYTEAEWQSVIGSLNDDLVEKVKTGLSKYNGHELIPYVEYFFEAGITKRIHPVFLIAISILETGWGRSEPFLRFNNAMGVSDRHSSIPLPSVEFGIDLMVNKLVSSTERYYEAKNVYQIGLIYSPPPTIIGGKMMKMENDGNVTNGDWIPSVVKIIKVRLGVDIS